MIAGIGPQVGDGCLCPSLSEAMIARVLPFGRIERVCGGARLSGAGSQLEDFFVLLEGEIAYRARHNETQVRFTTTERGQFSGELSLLTRDAGCTVGCVVVDSSVLRVSRDRFRTLLAAETDIAELVLGAFIHRRLAVAEGQAGSPLDQASANRRPGIHLALTMAVKGVVLALGFVPSAGWLDSVSQLVAG